MSNSKHGMDYKMLTNPDLNNLFDDYAKGAEVVIAWEGGEAVGYLSSMVDGIVTLSGPGNVYSPVAVAIPAGSSIQILLNEIVAVGRILA